MAQDDRSSSMLQTIARAIVLFTCLVFQNLTERFLYVVLDVLSRELPLPFVDRSLVDSSLRHRIMGKLVDPGPSRVFRGDCSPTDRLHRSRSTVLLVACLMEIADGAGRGTNRLQMIALPSSFDRQGGWTLSVMPTASDNTRAKERKTVEKSQ
jgi:hypothetical protein